MIAAMTQTQITFPVEVDRARGGEEAVWLSLVSKLLETRLLQLLRFKCATRPFLTYSCHGMVSCGLLACLPAPLAAASTPGSHLAARRPPQQQGSPGALSRAARTCLLLSGAFKDP